METSFDKLFEEFTKEINSFTSSERTEEELNKISAINEMALKLQEQHKALQEENTRLKDKIVDSIKFSGTSKQYDDVQPRQSMSFEEYAQNFTAKVK